jgi:hypothetical protein
LKEGVVQRLDLKAVRAIGLCCVLSIGACSTVIATEDGADASAMIEERAALKAAAEEARWAPWPRQDQASFADMIAGVDASEEADKLSRDNVVDHYLAKLDPAPDAQAALLADARRHLIAAQNLRQVAMLAGDSPDPRLSDVAIVEASIASLRETRAIYAATLKKLKAERQVLDDLKDAFDGEIKALGDAADALAEAAMQRRSSEFAGPGVRVARFNGGE